MIPERLEAWLAKADVGALHHGRTWYENARKDVQDVAAKHGVECGPAVYAAFACLSPRVPYQRNLTLLGQLLSTGRASTLRTAERDALRCLSTPGAEPSGRKVRAFYRCLMGDETAVCLDTWALRAAGVSESPSKTLFQDVERAYLDLARRAGMLPMQVQAIIWVTIRGSAW